MQEATIRKYHRLMGISLALFIILQAGTGLLLSLDWFETLDSHAHEEGMAQSTKGNHSDTGLGGAESHEVIEFIHHGGRSIMKSYRVILGLGLVAMALSGSTIFYAIITRTKQ